MDNTQEELDASDIIELLGGTNKTAELCEITPGAVSQWRKTGIPKSQLKYIKLARPECFVPQIQALSG
jgi:hypothetical protein